MITNKKDIFVYADWVGLPEAQLIGILHADHLKGKDIFSFEYDENWLNSGNTLLLDPDLLYFPGRQFLHNNKVNFGLFLDSSPDRWGRLLMKRRESLIAREEGREVRNLFESDFLLEVYDLNRMGALRYKLDADGLFLDSNNHLTAPPWASIRELEHASIELEKGIKKDSPDLLKWVNQLIAPGSSLGGARPKANISHQDNSLWIAKFPSNNDEFDVGLWEFIIQRLAKQAGINMAEGVANTYNNKHHTYLTKRFDRTDDGKRIHFASAMTLLGYTDGTDHVDGVSYLDLVEFLTAHGANVKDDLIELFKRIVFSICVSNTDDHLRNHGFLLTPKGWVLSPAYDINPNPQGVGLKLNISENDNSLDLAVALSVAIHFRLKEDEALDIINNIKVSVSSWKKTATQQGVCAAELSMMEPAFRAIAK